MEAVATASKLAIYVLSFAHQTARLESLEIARPRGIRRSVMVVTQKNENAPSALLACTSGEGRGVIAGPLILC